jgi:hypothetical protein
MPLIEIDKMLSLIIPKILKEGSEEESIVQGKSDY